MFGPKIRIERLLYRRLEEAAQKAGYSSTREFVTHALERAVTDVDEAPENEEVERQLRGLGYIE